jgi:hypothetical protein
MPRTLRLALAFAQEGSSLPSAAGRVLRQEGGRPGTPANRPAGSAQSRKQDAVGPTGAVLLFAKSTSLADDFRFVTAMH